jgi:hypothetical protein
MNIVTVADIKRSGFSIVESALEHGPVHLMKRNRPSAVLLRPADYDRLVQLAQRGTSGASNLGLEMLLAQDPVDGGLNAAALKARLTGTKEGWNER